MVRFLKMILIAADKISEWIEVIIQGADKHMV